MYRTSCKSESIFEGCPERQSLYIHEPGKIDWRYLVLYSVKAVIKNKKMKKVLNIKMNRYLQGTYLRFTALDLWVY